MNQFWRSVPKSSRILFLVGLFLTFTAVAWLNDIAVLGGNGPGRLVATLVYGGGMAVLYAIALRHKTFWVLPVIVLHFVLNHAFVPVFGAVGPPLAGSLLKSRLVLDVNGTVVAICAGFALVSHVVRREGTRYGRLRAEVALARDIHRHLVPNIERRIGAFEFRGISAPSGEVGGDLIDVFESSGGWTGYVVDVSGHGIAAGVLMGMVKSAARTGLMMGESLDAVLDTTNRVLFDLKNPAMFATFAGLQWSPGAGLRFAVAGHLPILQYHAATEAIEELSVAQLPLAMFEDRTFISSPALYAAGDIFLLLTDGLTEVFDARDEEFGLERIKAVVRDAARQPLEAIEACLLAAVGAHGAQFDDQTLLVIRVEG